MNKQIKVYIMAIAVTILLVGCAWQSEYKNTNTNTNGSVGTPDSEGTPNVSQPAINATVKPTPKSVNEGDIPFIKSGTFTGGNNENLEFNGEEVTIINSNDSIIITVTAFSTFDGVHGESNDVFPYTVKACDYPKYLLLTINSYSLYAPFQKISTEYLTMEEYLEEEFGWRSIIISSKEDIEFRVYDKTSPGRIIIEIRKAKLEKEYGTVFSVRSENVDRGFIEGAWFGDIPGSLRRDYGLKPRVLKTETGECIEATYFRNKVEAEQLLAEINNYDVKFFIEERGMYDIPKDYSTKIKEEYIPTMSKEGITDYIKEDVIYSFTDRGMKIGSAHIYIQDFDVNQQTIYAVIESDTLKRQYLYFVTFSNNDYPTVSMEQIYETDTDKIQLADEIKKQCIKYDIEIN